jgi:hypothetical protein
MTPAAQHLLDRALSHFPKAIPGALTQREVGEMRGLIDRILAESQLEEPDKNWCPLSWCLNPDRPRFVDDVLSLFVQTKAFAVTRELLGDKIVLLLRHCIVRRRDVAVESDRSPWHLDADFMGADGEMLNLWIPLSDVGRGHPGLTLILDPTVVTGTWTHWQEWASEHWSIETRNNANDLISDGSLLAELAGGYLDSVAKTPVLRAGDGLLFNQVIPHRTQDATESSGPRYSIELRIATADRLPETYRAVPLETALVDVSGGAASMRFSLSDRLQSAAASA